MEAAMPPSIPEASPPASPFLKISTPPAGVLEPRECRLCARESTSVIDIFSEAGKERGLPEKTRLCLPIHISEDDELPNTICLECCDKLEFVRAFFESCFNANQELIIHLRKTRGSPLDLATHINQYVRCFNTPNVASIKIEPSNYLDVNLDEEDEEVADEDGEGIDEDFDEEFEPNDSDDNDNESFDGESSEEDLSEDEKEKIDGATSNGGITSENQDGSETKLQNGESEMFKIPPVPRKRKRGRPKKINSDGTTFEQKETETEEIPSRKFDKKSLSNRGRKKIVPMSLKTCSECNEKFDDHASNLTHWRSHHPDKDVIYRCTEKNSETDQPCTFESKRIEDIFKHRSRHKSKELLAKEKLIDCKICGKRYTASYLINRHMLAHSDQKDFKCPVCAKEFKTSADLKIHLKVHEPEDLKYTHCCELCGKRFTQRANLDAHLRVHSGFKPFACDICEKSFSQKGNMEEHRRVHTGERPFVCELCGTSFVRRSEMALHTRISHTGERPYQCNFCPKSFQRRDLMRKHERIHTDTRPYACTFCGKTFTQRDKMVVHTRLHTGERPYVCDVCGKGFCESGNLKKHMRVHGKEPPPVMHQNNKGKPAPAQNSAYTGKYSNHQGRPVPASQFQQLPIEEDSNSQAAPEPDSTPHNLNTGAVGSQHNQIPPVANHGLSSSSNMPFNLKLEQQSTVAQYPLSAVAAAAAAAANLAHSQMSNHHHSLMAHHQQQSHHHSRSTNATPIHDMDNQSDACSERSVTSPFVPAPSVTPNPLQHSMHHHQQPAFPYPMHHSLLQHLNDWYGHLPQSGNAHNH